MTAPSPVQKTHINDDNDLPDSVLLYDMASRQIVKYDPMNDDFYYTSPKGDKQKFSDKECHGTQFTGNCDQFIGQLLADNNFSAFMKYSAENEKDFNLKIDDDIKSLMDIDPKIATKILNKFGFKIISEPSVNGEINKYETFPSWLKRFKEKLTGKVSKDTLESVENAKNLCNYLDRLVRHVNSNPVILNHELPNLSKKQNVLSQLPLDTVRASEDIILQMAEANKIRRMLMRQQPSYMFPIDVLSKTMKGGGTFNTKQLQLLINGLISDLKNKGVTIRQKDIDTINAYISSLDVIGDALSEVAKKLADYKKWIEIYPNMDNNKKMMSIGSIEDSIEKFKQYTLKHEQLENGLLNLATILSKKL